MIFTSLRIHLFVRFYLTSVNHKGNTTTFLNSPYCHHNNTFSGVIGNSRIRFPVA